jgi:hypothetical protein
MTLEIFKFVGQNDSMRNEVILHREILLESTHQYTKLPFPSYDVGSWVTVEVSSLEVEHLLINLSQRVDIPHECAFSVILDFFPASFLDNFLKAEPFSFGIYCIDSEYTYSVIWLHHSTYLSLFPFYFLQHRKMEG